MKHKLIVLFYAIAFILTVDARAQEINPNLLTKIWPAFWINVPATKSQTYGVYHFRKEFQISEKPAKFIIHVSADNRYKLFVNGKLLRAGQSRGDLHHWNFETLDIAPYLNSGSNTISSTVWNDGEFKGAAQITSRTGFILQGDALTEHIVNTNKSWKCTEDRSYSPMDKSAIGFFVAPPGETCNMNLATPEGWTQNEFDDSSWKAAGMIGAGIPKGVNAMGGTDWMLVKSTIPAMEMTNQRLQKVRQVEGAELPKGFPINKTNLVIPADSQVKILLDQTFLTNAYPTLEYSNGKDATITLTYSEGLYDDKMEKGNRNEVAGKKIIGTKDSLICNGLKNQTYNTLTWKTFRYIELNIRTKDQPLTISDFYGTFTGYPFKNNAKLMTDNSLINNMYQIGWRTARLCAVETYMDCPYYEQLQYIGDTRIQAMVSYYNSGDDRLAKQAISMINNSRLAEGITQSRYPATGDNIIPPFSLIWIGMLSDYYHYRQDTEFVKSHLPGSRQVLSFFDKYLDEKGALQNAPYWNFIDWPENPRGWKVGVPPLNKDGGSASLDFQLLWAYQWAAELENKLGSKSLAEEYRQKERKLKNRIVEKYWDSSRQLFADTDEKKNFSQHANTLAILTETVIGADAKVLFMRMDKAMEITRASIYFQYYVNQALKKVDLGDDYLDRLGTWKANIDHGMTTWGEDSNVSGTRSDCHAWGASPNIEFFRIIMGIDSDAPGFSKVRIHPNLGKLKKISGIIPHPDGYIKTDYAINQKGQLNAVIILPGHVTGIFEWKGQSRALKSGENKLTLNIARGIGP